MTPAQLRFWRRIQAKAATLQPDMARAYFAGIDALRDRLSARALESLIKAGAVERYVTMALSDANLNAAFSKYRAQVQQTTEQASAFFAKDIPGKALSGVFTDRLNPKVIDAIRALDSKVMQRLTTETRETVRAILENGLRDGTSARQTSIAIREMIGLGKSQIQEVANYRRALETGDVKRALGYMARDRRFDSTVRGALAAGKAETGAVWFHGTPADILKSKQGWFVASAGETGVPVVWGSSSIFTAEGYSRGELNLTAPDKFGKYGLSKSYYADTEAVGGVYSLRSKAGTRIFTFDAEGKQWFNISQRSVIQAAKAKGYDAVVFKNVADNYSAGSGMTSDVIAWLDPKSIKLAPEVPSAIPSAKIDKMVEAYTKRRIAINASTTAHTATMEAFKQGQRLSWEQAIEQGIVERGRLRRQWITVMDGRERPEHGAMNLEETGFDEPYPNGDMIIGESSPWNCRCTERVFVGRE